MQYSVIYVAHFIPMAAQRALQTTTTEGLDIILKHQ